MMKKRFVVVVMMVVLSMLLATGANAKVVRTPFTSTGTVVEILDPGVVTTPGGNIHIRGMVELMRTESEEDRIAGWHTMVVDCNFGVDGFGTIRGTYVLEVDAYDGGWEGSFTGKLDEDGMSFKMLGKGYGDLAGMQIKGTVLNGVTDGVIVEK